MQISRPEYNGQWVGRLVISSSVSIWSAYAAKLLLLLLLESGLGGFERDKESQLAEFNQLCSHTLRQVASKALKLAHSGLQKPLLLVSRRARPITTAVAAAAADGKRKQARPTGMFLPLLD